MRFCVLILCRLAKGQRVHVHLLESLVKGLGLKKKKGGKGSSCTRLDIKNKSNKINTAAFEYTIYIRQPHKLLFFRWPK